MNSGVVAGERSQQKSSRVSLVNDFRRLRGVADKRDATLSFPTSRSTLQLGRYQKAKRRVNTVTRAGEIDTYNFFRLYGDQLCIYCFDGQHNSGFRNLNEVWDTVTEDRGVDIVGNGQGIEFVHFRPGVSERTEVTVHLMLQQLLQRSEGLSIM